MKFKIYPEKEKLEYLKNEKDFWHGIKAFFIIFKELSLGETKQLPKSLSVINFKIFFIINFWNCHTFLNLDLTGWVYHVTKSAKK